MPTPHGGELAAFVYHASMFLSIIVGKAKNCRPFSDKIFLNAKIAKNPVIRVTFMEKNDNSPAFFPESQQNCHLFRPIRPLLRAKKAPTPVGVRAMWVWGGPVEASTRRNLHCLSGCHRRGCEKYLPIHDSKYLEVNFLVSL